MSSPTISSNSETDTNNGQENRNRRPPSFQELVAQQTWTQMPRLTERVVTGNAEEENMIRKIDLAIRCLLTQPNHQPPYQYNFQWEINDDSHISYAVLLCIREPIRPIQR
jgi:hypothetical protein